MAGENTTRLHHIELGYTVQIINKINSFNLFLVLLVYVFKCVAEIVIQRCK